jgi:hypothetical protein
LKVANRMESGGLVRSCADAVPVYRRANVRQSAVRSIGTLGAGARELECVLGGQFSGAWGGRSDGDVPYGSSKEMNNLPGSDS